MTRALPLMLIALAACAGGEDSPAPQPSGDSDAPPDSPADSAPVDLDGDGSPASEDCDDAEPRAFPGNDERPYDGVDNDCDPATPDDDLDGDGFGVAEDCLDEDPLAHPGAPDLPCDRINQDCLGTYDDGPETRVQAVSPAQLLPAGADLLIELDQAPLALVEGAVRLTGEQSGAIGGTTVIEGSALRFTPDRAPLPGERLHLTVRPLAAAGGEGRGCVAFVESLWAASGAQDLDALAADTPWTAPAPLRALLALDPTGEGRARLLSQHDEVSLHAAEDLSIEASLTAPPLDGRLIASLDLQADGRPDLIALSASAAATAPGDGVLAATPWQRFDLSRARIVDLAWGDLDGDGDLDAVAGVEGQGGGLHRLHVLYNDGAGVWVPAAGDGIPLDAAPSTVSMGDFDGDGVLDLWATTGEPRLLTFDNLGAEGFSPNLRLVIAGTFADMIPADLNRDGLDEAVLAGLDGRLWVMTNPTGIPTVLEHIETGLALQGLRLVDLNGDGRLDLLAWSEDSTQVYLGRSGGSFTLARAVSGGSPVALDLDGDGALELFTASGDGLTRHAAP